MFAVALSAPWNIELYCYLFCTPLPPRLYLLVAVQGKSQRTTPQEGPAPFWNETKEVPFVPTGPSFEAQSLKENADIVTFSVFDEVIDVEHVRIIYTSPSGE